MSYLSRSSIIASPRLLIRKWSIKKISGSDISRFFSLSGSYFNETIQPFDPAVCTSLLVENINNETQKWMCKRIENIDSRKLSNLDKITTLNRLMLVHCFELFQKAEYNFSDCEIALPAICSIIDFAVKHEVDSFVIGFSQMKMLGALSKNLNVPIEKLFLSVVDCRNLISGFDISSYYLNTNLKKRISINLLGLTSLPQTLCPLALGVTKALQDLETDKSFDKVWPILCYNACELSDKNNFTNIVQLSNDRKYSNNGTIHIVINEVDEEISPKSESQCNLVKIFADFIKAPIIHVRGEDVDSVVNVMQFAADFKITYKQDIVIDLITCANQNFPSIKRLTLPGLVKQLMTDDKPPLVSSYLSSLVHDKVVADISYDVKKSETLKGLQTIYLKHNIFDDDVTKSCINIKSTDKPLKEPETSSSIALLSNIGDAISSKPLLKDLDTETVKLLADRKKEFKNNKLSWNTCELLAHGTLLQEGINVCLSASRKCPIPTLNIPVKGSAIKEYNLVAGISRYLGNYKVLSTFISPYALAGFEMGYSSMVNNSLNIWMAPDDIQSKVLLKILRDFLSCAVKELKTKVTFIIPSYSTAVERDTRVYHSTQTKHLKNILEIFTDSNSENINSCEIVNLSTPANFFHILKKQAKSSIQKPLIIFVPYGYHKNTRQYSQMEDLSGETRFKIFLEDRFINTDTVDNLILCTGTVYYDLKEEILKRKIDNVSIGRIEKLFPFPLEEISRAKNKLKVKNVWWAQNEHYEDGWWSFVESKLNSKDVHVKYAGRSHATLPFYKSLEASEANIMHIFETIENANSHKENEYK